MEDLVVGQGVVIPARELEWRFDPSGGPGGQHANRSATRVELRFDLAASSAFGDEAKNGMLTRLGARARNGVVAVIVDTTRSQYRNRVEARSRLAAMLREAQRRPEVRRPTRPSRQVKRRRLESKRRRSELKRLRRRPPLD